MIGQMTLSQIMPYLRLVAEINQLNLNRVQDFQICRQILENLVK